jgi:hypothetical protein
MLKRRGDGYPSKYFLSPLRRSKAKKSVAAATRKGPPTEAALLRWLQSRRVEPIVQVRRRISLTGFPEHVVFFLPGWQARLRLARLFRAFSLADL